MTSDYFLSFLIIGTEVALTIVLLFGLWRALRASGRPPTEIWGVVLTLGGVLFGWLLAALFLGWLGLFRSAANQPLPYIALAIGLPILIGALSIFGSRRVREIIDAVPQSWLVGLQFYRVVGAIFLVLYAGGRLPGIFAMPAGYGDVFVGLTALLVACGYARYQSTGAPFVALWNWLGVADLVLAMATGFLSAPSRFQIFSLHAPNFLIGSFPLVMIPIYAVPLSLVLHLASLIKLGQDHAHLRERFGHSKMTDLGTV